MLFAGADSLCSRLNEKINDPHANKLALAHMPLLVVCLQVKKSCCITLYYPHACPMCMDTANANDHLDDMNTDI